MHQKIEKSRENGHISEHTKVVPHRKPEYINSLLHKRKAPD